MKLYTHDPSPNPARLKMFLDYKDIHLDTQQIDLAIMEQHSEDYLRLVPEGTVPALVLEDGSRLTEVIAIVHYLEAIYPERPLLGVTPLERAQVINWNHRLFQSLFTATAEAFRNAHPAFKDRALPGTSNYAQIPELAQRGRERLIQGIELMDRELAGRDFVAGNFLSFADIDLLVLLGFAKWAAKIQPDPALEHLTAWRERTQAALEA